MAQTSYTYAIDEFANDKVDIDAFETEIRGSSIVVALDHAIERLGPPHEVDVVFKNALSAGDKTTLDSLVAAHDGDPIPGPSVPGVRLEPARREDVRLAIHGQRFHASLDDQTTHNVTFAEDRFLQGVEGFVASRTSGDYIEVFTVLPGDPETMLAQLGETVYVPPSGEMSVVSERAMRVPAGIQVRFVYHSVGTTGDQPEVILHMRTWRPKD